MKKNNLILLFLIVMTNALSAAPFNGMVAERNMPEPDLSQRCNLPAPLDFHTISVGTNSARYGWTPQANAKHHILTRRSSDDYLLNDTIVPVGVTEATVSGLPEGTECYAVIHAVCEDGSDGPGSGEVTFTTMIIDIVVVSFQGGGTPQCTMLSEQTCPFPITGGPYTFKVTYGFFSREFGIRYNANSSRFEVCIGSGNAGQDLKFYCNHPDTTVPCLMTNVVIVKYQNTKVAEFSAGVQQSSQIKTGLFTTLSVDEGGMIESYLPGQNQHKGQHPVEVTNVTNEVQSSPNPFSETLNVIMQSPTQSSSKVELLRPDGQLLSKGRIEAGQTDYTFDTATLPTGFYFLRVQSGDQVQVLKVVKSE